MNSRSSYSYAASTKSAVSDELINTYAIRPAAGLIVRLLYHTPMTPNGVTALSLVAGFCSALLYAPGFPGYTLAAGLCITLKDILDSADGQLARAKGLFSRKGRFFDSIGDFLVNFFVFAAIGWALVRSSGQPGFAAAALLCFLGTTLRVSYHVFYQSSYLHHQGSYTGNRITEEMTGEDRNADRMTRALQQIFLFLYGWQDRLMSRIDAWSHGGLTNRADIDARWYGDRIGLRLSGLLGLGTELFILMLFSLMNEIKIYLLVNLVFLNLLWGISIVYRRWVLQAKVGRN